VIKDQNRNFGGCRSLVRIRLTAQITPPMMVMMIPMRMKKAAYTSQVNSKAFNSSRYDKG
jgi:hypothetical protein